MSYLEVMDQSTIADSASGFFGSETTVGNADKLLSFMAKHPAKKMIWLTSSLARNIGTGVSQSFNDQMRTFTSSALVQAGNYSTQNRVVVMSRN